MPKINRDFKARDQKVELNVVTYSVLTDLGATLATLQNNGASIHHLIEENANETIKLDEKTQVSFCCGVSQFRNKPTVNEYSINTMLMNDGKSPFKPEQINTLITRLKKDGEQFPYLDPKKDIAGLGEVAIIEVKRVEKDGKLVYLLDKKEIEFKEGEGKIFPRHIAPGKFFPWKQLADQGLGLFIETTPEDKADILLSPDKGSKHEILALQKELIEYGLAIQASEIYDEATKDWVTRFNQRYVPDPNLQIDGTQKIDPSVWSKASQRSLNFILEYINKKTNTNTQLHDAGLFKLATTPANTTTEAVKTEDKPLLGYK